MEPSVYRTPPPPPVPGGHWLTRGLRAVLIERRLPYNVELRLDQLCDRVGLHNKTVSAAGYKVRMQRLGTGPQFFKNIILNNEYTPAGYEIRETDTVIDIGGNIGIFAMMAAKRASRGRVFTFEPVSENYALLTRNIRLNGLRNVDARQAAILTQRQRVKIYLSTRNTGSHSIHLDTYRVSGANVFEEVETVPLSDVMDANGIDRCDFLKIDCEGAEFDILYGLPRSYFSRIRKIAMEYHCSSNETKRVEGQQLVAYLESVGFVVDIYQEFAEFRGGHLFARRPH